MAEGYVRCIVVKEIAKDNSVTTYYLKVPIVVNVNTMIKGRFTSRTTWKPATKTERNKLKFVPYNM